MQDVKRNKRIVLIAALLAVVIVISLFLINDASNPVPKSTPSPITTFSSAPTQTEMPPTSTPTATITITPSPTPSSMPTPPRSLTTIGPNSTPEPTLIFLYPGEVTQYQGENLSAIVSVYQNAIEGTQYIDQTTYRLAITGLVNKTLQYTYDDVVGGHQKYQKVVTIHCIEGWNATILWEGILVNDLLQEAGVSPETTTIIFHASDGYSTALPLDYIIQNNIIIAYKMNDVPLNAHIGWPFMLVAQSQYGYKWIKWLTQIEASNDTSYLGYWESQGYPNNATVYTNP